MRRQGGIRDGKKGMCSPFGWGMDAASYELRTMIFCSEQRDSAFSCEQRIAVL
jgi:hypothetical protein